MQSYHSISLLMMMAVGLSANSRSLARVVVVIGGPACCNPLLNNWGSGTIMVRSSHTGQQEEERLKKVGS